MDPEVVIGILGVFVSGGALGVGGTLLSQWAHRKLSWKPYHAMPAEQPELAMLRSDVGDLSRTLAGLHERMEFQEQLLSGASPQRIAETPSQQPEAEAAQAPASPSPADPPAGEAVPPA